MNVLAGGADSARLPRWLLVAGLVAGAAAAAVGLKAAPAAALPPQAAARVGDRLILRDEWLRAVAAVASERRTPLTEADQRRILERLVDEELLVQHGVALGLVEHDARLRSTLVQQVLQVATGAPRLPEDDAALRRFYEEQRAFFAPAARLRVRAYRVGADGARRPFEPAVPDALLPVAKLQLYLGPPLTAAAQALPAGAASAPLPAAGGPVVVEVLESQPGAAPPFEQVREPVRAEARRRADEAAVRALLAELRARTDIALAPQK